MTEPTLPMPSPGKPPRRRRRGVTWLIAVVVLLGLLVAADRIALAVAQSQLAGRIQTSQHLSQKPGVSIDGFPFLTQVVSRDFGHATVDIRDFPANGVTISDLHADLHGVHVNSGFNGATADTLVATAQITYTEIAKALAAELKVRGVQVGTIQIAYSGDDQIKATYDLLGVKITAIIDVALTGTNELEFKSVKIDTPLSGLVTPPNFDVTHDLGALPLGMKLTELTFTSTAVDVTAAGTHVNLSQKSASLR